MARRDVGLLIALNPAHGYFPDMLTPAEASDGLEAGIQAILNLPKQRLKSEIEKLATEHGKVSAKVAAIGDGDPRILEELGVAFRTYHTAAVDDVSDWVRMAFDADRVRRAQTLLDGGVGALLDGLHTKATFNGTVLEITDYPSERDLYLGGRGLRLVPSFFKVPDVKPITLTDPDLPQVLVYPVDRSAGLAAAAAREPLSALLGRTRASLLEAAVLGGSTTELARRVSISAPAASQHLTVLREAGLIISVRDANVVRHTATSLGNAMLHGAP
jgi:DNA-binding transcriptional ArsR family regulator